MEQTSQPTLAQIPANRRLVDELYAHGKISHEARAYALDFLYPADKWGVWISRLLLVVGTALVLSGIVYFFAFNWARITPLVKLSSIQGALFCCLLGAYYYKLERVSGQILLLSASVLTGVFMAVFGQIYQTGADAYQLFMMWSVFILGWTVISNFAPQWILWLAVTNIFLGLWWDQAALPDRDREELIFVIFAVFNGSMLALREVFVARVGAAWLDQRWVRILLTIVVLLPLNAPLLVWVLQSGGVNNALKLSAAVGVIGHGLLYAFYRFKVRDMWSLAAIALSVCVILEAAVLDLLVELFDGSEFILFLSMGIATIGIFSLAVLYLRRIIAVMEADHV